MTLTECIIGCVAIVCVTVWICFVGYCDLILELHDIPQRNRLRWRAERERRAAKKRLDKLNKVDKK